MIRPITISVMSPFAAAATAMTLSRLITASAISTTRTAAIRLAPATHVAMRFILNAAASSRSRTAAAPPKILRPRNRHQRDDHEGEGDAHHDRRAAAEQDADALLLGGGSVRQASAITTALSPDRHDVDADDLEQRCPEVTAEIDHPLSSTGSGAGAMVRRTARAAADRQRPARSSDRRQARLTPRRRGRRAGPGKGQHVARLSTACADR